MPTSVTIWEAAAPPESLAFLPAGAAVLIPPILAYTAYSSWVFRGKAQVGGGYHEPRPPRALVVAYGLVRGPVGRERGGRRARGARHQDGFASLNATIGLFAD